MLMTSSKNLRRRSPMTPATIIETVVSQGWFGFGRRVDRCFRLRLPCSREDVARGRPTSGEGGRPCSGPHPLEVALFQRPRLVKGDLDQDGPCPGPPRSRPPRSRPPSSRGLAALRATSPEAILFEATQLNGPRCSMLFLPRPALLAATWLEVASFKRPSRSRPASLRATLLEAVSGTRRPRARRPGASRPRAR